MLTLHFISGPRASREAFAAFDPLEATWIVSDLKSKLDLNRELLRNRTFVLGDSVLRASELWKKLLTRVRPDLQIVSREFIVTLISHKLAGGDLAWAKAPGAASAAYDYMTQLMPVLAHPNGNEMITEWFKQNEASHARWGRWFELSVSLWKDFLEEGFIAAPWASGILANESQLAELWSRPLVVDLGPELDQVEADLLVQLSEAVDIQVLVPKPSWAGEFGKALSAYEVFEKKLHVERTESEPAPLDGPQPLYRKYTTMLAEVKEAVAQARLWLDGDEGDKVAPREIAIVAPDIEAYWPTIASYLEQEGIPCQKNHVRRLHTYPDISRWLANLRLRTGQFAEADLELAVFESQAGSRPRTINYERFKTLYSMLYGREDLARSESIAKRFHADLQPGDLATRDEFVGWSLKLLPEAIDFERVETVYKKLFAECPQGLSLSVQRWMAYLEQLASKVECTVRDGDLEGIAVINLSSAENSPAKKMIVVGLTESALRPAGGTSILFSDINSLSLQFGFHLASEDRASLEFEARWVITDGSRDLLLTVAETDFAGSAQAGSWLWVRGAREAASGTQLAYDHVSLPRPTRWDELQRADLSIVMKERAWSASHAEYLERSLSEDLGEAELADFGQDLVQSLSPSGIEDYLDCPFVFAAKRLFALSDVAELDLEVDPSRRGSLMHKLFELLSKEPVRFDLSNEELGAKVEEAREASQLELADVRLWGPLRAKYVDLGRRFLDFEKYYRQKFPEAKTIAREADIAGFLEIATGKLVNEPSGPALKFLGRIDRIDADADGHLAIFDYKSSVAGVSQYGSWMKNNHIQLLLYAMAVENGLSELPPQPVLAALYYVSRPFNRDFGYKVTDAEQGLYEATDKRKRNRLTLSEKTVLFDEAKARVKEAIDGIRAGRFTPKPRDARGCTQCQWSSLCRAPHLSL